MPNEHNPSCGDPRWAWIIDKPSTFTPSAHSHVISDVTGLQDAIDNAGGEPAPHNHDDAYAPLVHNHDGSYALPSHDHDLDYAPLSHTHDYAATGHNHDASYANISHGHAISDVTNLQTTLNGKAATSHSHAISDTTGLQTALDGKAASSHTHAQSDVTNLVTALSGKQDTSAKGQANGYASLGADGKVPSAQLPASSGGGMTFVRSSADVTNATTTPSNVTGCSFSFDANSVYVIDLWGMATSAAATTGYGFAIDTSVAVTYVGLSFVHALATTGTLSGGDSIADATPRGLSSGVPAITVTNFVGGKGILVSGANAGTAQLTFRPEVAASATVKQNTVLGYQKVS